MTLGGSFRARWSESHYPESDTLDRWDDLKSYVCVSLCVAFGPTTLNTYTKKKNGQCSVYNHKLCMCHAAVNGMC